MAATRDLNRIYRSGKARFAELTGRDRFRDPEASTRNPEVSNAARHREQSNGTMTIFLPSLKNARRHQHRSDGDAGVLRFFSDLSIKRPGHPSSAHSPNRESLYDVREPSSSGIVALDFEFGAKGGGAKT